MRKHQSHEGLIYCLLKDLGHDMDDPHLKETPKRFVKFLKEFCRPKKFKFTVFDSAYDEMVLVGPVAFTSLCCHHLLAFTGNAFVAYIPDGKIVGLSKLPRTVDYFSASLQVQEKLTQDIADFIDRKLQPKGVAVLMEASHSCMECRGVKKPGALTKTICLRGAFKEDSATRAEFFALIGRK